MSINRILVIDGMYLIFSSFYVNRNMRTLKGEPSGAVFGFVNRIEFLSRELKPDKIIVAMDSKGKTFRHELYPEYKKNRDLPPEELIVQIEPVIEYLDYRGIAHINRSGFEADDIIANLAKSNKNENEVVIFSADKDLYQLVGSNVNLFHPKVKKVLDREGIKELFGIYPEQIVDYLSLTGDSSDNIPGVPGIGEKGAKKLLSEFGTLDNLLKKQDEVPERYKKKLNEGMDSLKMSRELVDLSYAPKLDLGSDELDPSKKSSQKLIEFYKRYSFNSLLKKAGVTEKKEQNRLPDTEYGFVLSTEDLKMLRKRVERSGYFAFDIETTGLEFHSSEIAGISFGFKDAGFYIPFIYPDEDREKVEITFDDFRDAFIDIFRDPNIKKTGHNIKFDILHLKSRGIEVRGVANDSMIISYLLFPNRRAHKLKELTYEFLGYSQTPYDELTGTGKNRKGFDEIPFEKAGIYCIDDSILSLRLSDKLLKKVEEKGLNELYENVEIPLIPILCSMEYEGVKVDKEFFQSAKESLYSMIELIKKDIVKTAGYEINLNSSQQLGVFLFEKMNLPAKKKTRKTGSYSTDIEVLEELKGFPVVAKIIEYRTLKKLLSTYIDGILDCVDEGDRVHTSYNQTVAATGRLSSSDPNIQNIPTGESGGIVVRSGFIAEKDMILLAADYSQVELRVMAHFSNDENLKKAFYEGLDIHKFTADTVYGKDLFLSDEDRRKRAKIINFSVLYGSGPFSLSKELGVSYREAKEFIDSYFDKYVGVRKFMDETINSCKERGFVETFLGRKRDIPEINSSNRNVRENGERIAVNTVIQGSAADIIKIAMKNIFDKLETMKSKMIMQVHDELIFELPEDEKSLLVNIVTSEMEKAVKLRVPLKVKVKTGFNWGNLN